LFADPDEEGSMQYEAITETPEEAELLGLTLNEENILSINPAENYYTPPEGILIRIIARDRQGAETPHAFRIILRAVNDAPSSFDLTEGPAEEVFVARDTSLTFEWTPSTDVDGDNLTYELVFAIEGKDTVHTFPATEETQYTVEDLAGFLNSQGISEEDSVKVTWSVNAKDGETIVPSSSVKKFNVLPKPNAKQEDSEALPTEFRCNNIYPNPVNGDHVSMILELPKETPVRFSLFDISGRQIEGGSFSQTVSVGEGIRPVTLSIPSLNSGTYFVLVEQNGKRVTKRMQVLR